MSKPPNTTVRLARLEEPQPLPLSITRASRSATPLLRQNPLQSSRSSPNSPRQGNAILWGSWNVLVA